MLEKYGNFEDVKEEFLTSYLVDGNERAFRALAPTHLIKRYVANPLYSFLKDHKLNLSVESLSYEINNVW